MPRTIHHFRDNLHIDQNLVWSLSPHIGDTIVLAGRQVTLASLPAGYDYVIAAEDLTVPPNTAPALYGHAIAVTVLARTIKGRLSLTCGGADGGDGSDGADGASGEIDDSGHKPVMLPGESGEPGGNGGNGGNGGIVTIRYSSAEFVPIAFVPGGSAGMGGKGGAGGAGKPPGRPGRNGRPGTPGLPGTVDIAEVDENSVWDLLTEASAAAWASYRAEVAGYLFRKFDPASQIAALNDARMALVLNPEDAEAAEIQSRITLRQIPSGLARDLDIAPDYPALAANLTAEIAVVQNAFQMYFSAVSLETIAQAIRDQLSTMALQLVNRQMEAQADVGLALQDVQIAAAEKSNVQAKINAKQAEINAMSDRSFSLGGFLTSVGAVAGFVAGVATGVGAIISIPAGLAALQRVADGLDIVELLKKLDEKAKDPKNKTPGEEDVDSANGLSGDLKDLIKGTKTIISFPKIIGDLERAMGLAGQGSTGKLLKEQAVLVREKMVTQLREKQARARVDAAVLRVRNLQLELEDIQGKLANWSGNVVHLTAATHTLIRAARRIVDMVMEDVFLAQRAREIYEMDDLKGLRFDFGHLHPDQDYSVSTISRATASLASLQGFVVQVLAWNKIYQRLNVAQIGYDLIQPELSVSITDPEALQAFANGEGLEFSLDLADVPIGMFELKANAMGLSLVGASSSQSTNVWITHSGKWQMNRRTDGSVANMHLLARSAVFGCSPATGTLTATLPPNPQSSPDAGPPFSFWGRGVASTYRLRLAQPSPADLSQLSAINITIDCLGYAPQGSGALVKKQEILPVIRTVNEPEAIEAMAVAAD